MDNRKYQIRMRLPAKTGGRFIVTYKVAIDGQLRTIMGSGLTMEAARDQAERQIRAASGGKHEALKSLKGHGLDSGDDTVPF